MARRHGSMYERTPGTWVVRVTCGTRQDGSRRTVTRTVHGTEADADREREALWWELTGRADLARGVTLDQYWERQFLPVRERVLRNGSVRSYRSCWERHVSPALGSRDISLVTHADVQSLVARLQPPATARKALTTLRAVLNSAVADGVIDRSPIRGRIRLPRSVAAHKLTWTAQEVMEAARRLEGDRMEVLFLLMAGFGLRRSEAAALTVPDDLATTADHSALLVTVGRTLTADDGWGEGDKTARVRVAAAAGPLAERLAEIGSALADEGRSVPSVASTRTGARLTPGAIPKAWRTLFAEGGPLSGMPYIELESLRHTNVTLAAMGGATDSANSLAHGHSERVAFSHYLARDGRLAVESARAVARALDGARTP